MFRPHAHEQDRLDSLRSYTILDTAPEPSYDAITRLAATICNTPVALISLVDEDRQWFKSRIGMDSTGTTRELSFCSDAVAADAALVVPDARKNARYATNDLVTGEPNIRAYAGMPIIGRDGLPLGTLCVIDTRARRFSTRQLDGLALLADQVVAQLELRRVDQGTGRLGPDVGLGDLQDPRRLRQALDAGELYPHFQPMVDLRTGNTIGFEALLRWHHPDHGVLPPSVFLPAIETSRLIIPVGRHVLDRSLAMLAGLHADPAVSPSLGVAVNVSAVQLQRPGLAETVLQSLEHYRVPAFHLTVEVTETVPLADTGSARRELQILADAGVHLALDDYGIGCSALSRLLELPLSALKLDRTLVAGLPDDKRSAAIARSTFVLADEMGIDVICEGVETEAQRQALLALGGVYAQGWLFGRVMDTRAVIEHLHGRHLPQPHVAA
jgi:EAL domain-containing protein (putative c-di-GMP-specific phosphodiesterase class I)